MTHHFRMENTMKRRQMLFVALVLAVAAWLGFVPESALGLPLIGFGGETATTTDYDEMMKIVFDDTVITETVYDTELLDLMPDGEVKTGPEGRWFETSQLYQSPGSWGSRGQNGYIPQAGKAAAVNARINLKKAVGSIEETAEVLKKIRTDKAAFLNWSDEQFPLFKEGLVDDVDRQLVGDGSGIRARVNAAVPATTLIVDSTVGVAGWDHTLMQFRRGMHLRASPNQDGSAPRATVMTVEQLDWDSDAIVVDDVTGIADNDYLFEGDAADNSAGKDMMGLPGLIDDGGIVSTLQNIDRTVHLWFRSYVHDFAAQPLTELGLIQADREARFRGGGRVDTIIISEEGFDKVWGDVKDSRVMNDPRAYVVGRKGITVLFGGTRSVELRTARKMPSTLAFGLQRDQLRKFLLHEFEWDDTTGAIWRQVTDANGIKDAFYCYGTGHGEIGIKSPQKCWRAENWAA